ncbi:hypothetical protein, partial [Terriglobus sp. RCC_193]|uniref:hypothetical protein n=1 Tax=Terriglobus sp. RCC_193 TaxID=3239218 RepID=UPI003523DA69
SSNGRKTVILSKAKNPDELSSRQDRNKLPATKPITSFARRSSNAQERVFFEGAGLQPCRKNPQTRKPRGQKDKQEHEANPAYPQKIMAGTKPKASRTLSSPKPPDSNKPKEINLAGYFHQTTKIETRES